MTAQFQYYERACNSISSPKSHNFKNLDHFFGQINFLRYSFCLKLFLNADL